MEEYIFDLECDGLNPTKIHVLSVGSSSKGILDSTNDYDRMRKFFSNPNITMVAHNCWRYDIPVAERILGIKVKCKVVDTLPLGWYVEHQRKEHGLESWGEEFGIPKPKIKDWLNLTYKEYRHRCERDVQINIKLWERLKKKLDILYDGDYQHLIDYLNFKMYCAMLQEKSRWRLDVYRCKQGIEQLSKEKEEKVKALYEAMPRVPIVAKKTRPKKPYKQDGSYSATGQAWFSLLQEKGLSKDYDGVVKVVTGEKEPNPNSHDQIKSWLYSLGWKPQTVKFVRNKETNEVKEVPQINSKYTDGVCESVKTLYNKEPRLELLDGLSILSHRISILEGFMRDVDDEGYVQAKIQGLTNTLRFKHAVVVNLPGVDRPYGELIRGCLIADEGYELCGADVSGLEDCTKQSFIWPYDPGYVREMMKPGFCNHVDIALRAGLLTKEQAERHRTKSFIDAADKEEILAKRKKAKPINFGALYNQQPKGIARETGMSLEEARHFYETYWKRNWAVKKVANLCKVKDAIGSKWLYNSVSKIWYSLRTDGDRFSVLNQSTGAYCFDKWLEVLLSKREQLTGQMHDELIIQVKKGYRKDAEKLLRWAIAEANKQLKLNRALDISVKFGQNYSEIH